nr:hypothetical protein [uncultured Cohaesibacter sp.]
MPAYAGGASTVKEFLKWETASQDNYFHVSILMAAYIAAQVDKDMGNCITRWYQNDPKNMAQRNDEIREMMSKAPDFHPSATLLAIIQKQCGRFADR